MNCPSCGAPMRLASGNASLRCDFCKSVMIAKADDTGVQFLDEVVELMCPVCSVPLWSSVLAALKIEACKQCHGLLVPLGAFEELIERMRGEHPEVAIPAPGDPLDLQQKAPCPKCHQRMETHYYFGGGHAVMSTCERCELHWMNGGVLMRIVHAPRDTEVGTGN